MNFILKQKRMQTIKMHPTKVNTAIIITHPLSPSTCYSRRFFVVVLHNSLHNHGLHKTKKSGPCCTFSPVASKMPSTIVQQIDTARCLFNLSTTRPLAFRAKQLKSFLKFVQNHESDIIDALHKDMRKQSEEARLEVLIAINHIKYILNNLSDWTRVNSLPRRFVDWLDGVYVYNDPLGVVLVMAAWNVPLLTLLPVAGAIAAGNCVIIKPSHNAPHFADLLLAKLGDYLHADCYPVILGGVEETKVILEQRFDYIYYTGSINVGKIVHAAATKYLTPVTLELGGKNAVYIDDSAADLLRTTRRIMWGKCFNSGQACISPDYVLCSKKVEIEFIKHAKSVLCEFFGDNVAKSCPIINDLHFNRLLNLLKDQEIALGGQVCHMENFIEPTILINVKETAAVMHEEIFGPILAIVNVSGVQQAINFINRREKALALYVFTEDSKVRDQFLANTSSGGVTVNDTLMHLMVENLPFGGVGMSGMGRYKGRDCFDTFVHRKSVLIKRFGFVVEKINRALRYPPYSARKSKVIGMVLASRKGLPINFICLLLFCFVVFVCFLYFVFQ